MIQPYREPSQLATFDPVTGRLMVSQQDLERWLQVKSWDQQRRLMEHQGLMQGVDVRALDLRRCARSPDARCTTGGFWAVW